MIEMTCSSAIAVDAMIYQKAERFISLQLEGDSRDILPLCVALYPHALTVN
jgi:hypothetical protein